MKCLVGMYDEGSDTRIIVNDDAKCHIGTIGPAEPKRRGPPYRVWNGEGVAIAVVASVAEAVWALAVHYKTSPPRWERRSATRYERYTEHAELRVDRSKTGWWRASRVGCNLMRNGQIAMFAAREGAEQAADRHVRDGHPNSASIDDGLTWAFSAEPFWEWLSSNAAAGQISVEAFYV